MNMILMISDMHIGRRTRTFNYDVFKERLDILCENFISLKKIINRSFALNRLDILLLGDILDGEEIFRGHGYEVEMNIDDAIQTAVNDIALMINKMLSRTNFEEVRVFGVPGNHGVANRNGSVGTNWEKAMYRLLAERLSYEVYSAKDWYIAFDVGDRKAIAMHGDNIKMTNQIPFYGINRNVLRWRAGGLGESDFDYVFLGHFHVLASMSCNDVRTYLNGTMLDGDTYVERMGLKPDLKYWLLVYDDEGNIVMEVPISLDVIMFK